MRTKNLIQGYKPLLNIYGIVKGLYLNKKSATFQTSLDYESFLGTIGCISVNSCRNLFKSVERQVYIENTHVPDKESGYDHFNDALGYFIEYVYPLRRDFKPNKPTRWS